MIQLVFHFFENLQEVLLEYPGVFMMDSSIRFISGHLDQVITDLLETGGVLGFSLAGHSNFATTHHQMYEYLPTDIHGMQVSDQMESGSVFYFRTRKVCEDILHWLLLCALEKSCIAPTRNRGCLPTNHRTEYADCHRFDQSALNIVLANEYGFDHEHYVSKEQIIKVKRYSWGEEEITVCRNGGKEKVQTELLFPGRVHDWYIAHIDRKFCIFASNSCNDCYVEYKYLSVTNFCLVFYALLYLKHVYNSIFILWVYFDKLGKKQSC